MSSRRLTRGNSGPSGQSGASCCMAMYVLLIRHPVTVSNGGGSRCTGVVGLIAAGDRTVQYQQSIYEILYGRLIYGRHVGSKDDCVDGTAIWVRWPGRQDSEPVIGVDFNHAMRVCTVDAIQSEVEITGDRTAPGKPQRCRTPSTTRRRRSNGWPTKPADI